MCECAGITAHIKEFSRCWSITLENILREVLGGAKNGYHFMLGNYFEYNYFKKSNV